MIFQEFSDNEICAAFAALIGTGIPLDMLSILAGQPLVWSQEYRAGIETISEMILEEVQSGSLKRWDFDLQDRSRRLVVFDEWDEAVVPREWNVSGMRAVLFGLVGCYRKKCLSLSHAIVEEIELAQSFGEVTAAKLKAIKLAILVEENDRLLYNFSILDSKKVWQAYHDAMNYFSNKVLRYDENLMDAKIESTANLDVFISKSRAKNRRVRSRE